MAFSCETKHFLKLKVFLKEVMLKVLTLGSLVLAVTMVALLEESLSA
jgi:hypothetical protein